jgi:hypothetical protein
VNPERYEIRVKGKLSSSLQTAFEGMTARIEPVETVLSGTLEDQAALYGVLEHVHALGLELVEVRRVALADRDSGVVDFRRRERSEE